jgi:hypothetical protein
VKIREVPKTTSVWGRLPIVVARQQGTKFLELFMDVSFDIRLRKTFNLASICA